VPIHPPLIRVLFALAVTAFVAAASPARADGKAGDFDFYVLALTWTPTYCATADNPDPAQCNGSPHGFLVHGFWPEYVTGYPDYCPSSLSRGLRQSTLDKIATVMPSAGLARYEWRKHGMCSGLSEGDYFGLLKQAADKIVIPAAFRQSGGRQMLAPAAIENAFVSANPGLARDGMAVACSSRQLTEVRICMTKDLDFTRCLEVDDDGCRSASISVPPVR
jgi:ribonuclease T2